MRRKTVLLTLGALAAVFGLVFICLYALFKHEPGFYKNAAMPEGEERKNQSHEFTSRFGSLASSVRSGYPDWWEVFTADQINGFLQEEFIHSWGGDENLPDGFHDLRVQVEQGQLSLGCRYGNGFWSTILSIDVRVWLVENEENRIALEVVNLRAGAISVSRQIILDYITEAARRNNIDARWYHRDGNPVAILKLQADQLRPTIQLQRFELQSGKIIIMGRSTENNFDHSAANTAP